MRLFVPKFSTEKISREGAYNFAKNDNSNRMKATEADTILPRGTLHLHPPLDVASSAQPRTVLIILSVVPSHPHISIFIIFPTTASREHEREAARLSQAGGCNVRRAIVDNQTLNVT